MDSESLRLLVVCVMLLLLAIGGFAKGWEECEKHYGLKDKEKPCPRCN